MKYLLSLFTCLLFVSATAQNNAVYSVDFDDNVFMASQISLDLPKDMVKDYWDEFWDDRFDIDVDRKDRDRSSETFLAEQVRIGAVSDKSFDLWSKLTENGNDKTIVALAVSFGYDISAGPDNYPAAFNQGVKYLDEFRIYAYDQYYNARLEELREELDDVRNDREDAADDQQKSNRRIEKWLEKIEKYEQRIAEERASLNEEQSTESNKAERVTELERQIRQLEQEKARKTRS